MKQPLSDYLKENYTRIPTMSTARKWCEKQIIPAEQINGRWYVIVGDKPAKTKSDLLVTKVLKHDGTSQAHA